MNLVTDADRIAAKGVPITLSDGVERVVRFDLEALLVIEEKFGSVGEFAGLIDADLRGKGLRALIGGLTAALEPALDEDSVKKLFDTRERVHYQLAIVQALNQAFKPAEESGKVSAGTNESRGLPSTSSSAPISAETTEPSGE